MTPHRVKSMQVIGFCPAVFAWKRQLTDETGAVQLPWTPAKRPPQPVVFKIVVASA